MPTATLTVPSRVEFVRPATAFLVTVARALGVSSAFQPMFEVAISEAVTNAVKYGSATITSTVTCEVTHDTEAFTIRIMDDGTGFVIPNAGLPEVSREAIESLPASGYGLPIIRTVFPVVQVVDVDGRFALELAIPRAGS